MDYWSKYLSLSQEFVLLLLIWPIISFCTLFNRFNLFHDPLYHSSYQLLFCMHKYIDADSLIGSILFHTWRNFIDISSLSQVPESFTFMFKVSSGDYSKTLFPRFDHFSIYASFHLRWFLSLESICIPSCRCDYQFYIILLEHQYLLEHL